MKAKSEKQKLDQAQKLLDVLVNKKDSATKLPFQQTDRFYYVLRIFQQARKDYEASIVPNPVIPESKAECCFDRPKREITSLVHERWKKRIDREINNRFKNRR